MVHSPSEASLISVCVAAPPSATQTQLLDCSDDDNVTESHEGGAGKEGKGGRQRGGNYKGWLGTNLPAVQFSPQPVAATISTESSAAHTAEDEGVKEEVNSQNMYLQPPTMGTCKGQEEEQQEEEKEPSSILPEVNLLTLTFGTQYNPKEKEEKDEQQEAEEEEKEVKPPSVSLEVNLLTLTFGTQHNPKEKEEEEESHLLSELTEGAEQWTQEGEEEEEEEQDPDYIGRPYFSRQN